MSVEIRKEKKEDKDKTIIELDNGHAEALAKITKDYNLIGEKEAISFMLSVFADAEGKSVKINETSFMPSDKIKKPPIEGAQ